MNSEFSVQETTKKSRVDPANPLLPDLSRLAVGMTTSAAGMVAE
jgi:hypothetical protein